MKHSRHSVTGTEFRIFFCVLLFNFLLYSLIFSTSISIINTFCGWLFKFVELKK